MVYTSTMSNRENPLVLPAHVVSMLRVHVASPEFAARFPDPSQAEAADAAEFFTNWLTDEMMDEMDSRNA